MILGNDYKKVTFTTTNSTGSVLVAASGTRVHHLHALHAQMISTGSIKIESVTATSTAAITPLMPAAANTSIDWQFAPMVQGALSGKRSGNLQVSSTAGHARGWAVVSWTTST